MIVYILLKKPRVFIKMTQKNLGGKNEMSR